MTPLVDGGAVAVEQLKRYGRGIGVNSRSPRCL